MTLSRRIIYILLLLTQPLFAQTIFFEGTVSTLSGGTSGYLDGAYSAARFNNPSGMDIDQSGNIYVADAANHRIRKIEKSGNVITIAGSGTAGYQDGAAATARFNNPKGVAVDREGNIYVADTDNHRIRKITPEGSVSTLCGSGVLGYADGNATAARFSSPVGLAILDMSDLFVSDQGNHCIRKINIITGTTFTHAGSGGVSGFVNNTGTAARFNRPAGMTIYNNLLYVADSYNHCIRRITTGSAGAVTTLAGSGTAGLEDNNSINSKFNEPLSITANSSGEFFILDSKNFLIRKATNTGIVTTVSGFGSTGVLKEGLTSEAGFASPFCIVADTSGKLFISENSGHRIRTVAFPKLQQFTTTAGTASASQTFNIFGRNLTDVLTLGGSSAFEFSLNSTGPYTASLISISPTSGRVAALVYARLRSSNTVGSLQPNLSLTSTGARVDRIPVSLVVNCASTQTPAVSIVPVNIMEGNHTFTATASNTGSGIITYNFKKNGVSQQNGSSPTWASTGLATGNTITCEITVTGASCLSQNTAVSNTVTVQCTPVSPSVTISPATATSGNHTFTATSLNTGGGTVSYEFRKNGSLQQSGSVNTWSASGLVAGDVIQCFVTITGGTCISVNSILSNSVTVSNCTPVTPAVSISPVTVTEGAQVFTASASNVAGGSVAYRFTKNGIQQQQSASATWNAAGLQKDDVVQCTITITGGSCLTSQTAISNQVKVISAGIAVEACTVNSSSVKFDWAQSILNEEVIASYERYSSAAIDGSGNIYRLGTFSGTRTFGSFSLTSAGKADIVISKQNSAGEFLWAKRIGGLQDDKANMIASDQSGNIYITGTLVIYSGSVDIDPGSTTFLITPKAYEAGFIAKLDTDGIFIWGKKVDASPEAIPWLKSIFADASGVYLTGASYNGIPSAFDSSIDPNQYETKKGYITKLRASDGSNRWTRQYITTGANMDDVTPRAITVDAQKQVYVTGSYSGTINFGQSQNSLILTTSEIDSDVYVSKMDSSGNLLWAKSMGGSLRDVPTAIAVDLLGNVYTTGTFDGVADFDPGAGTYTFTPTSPGYNTYFSKLNSEGNFVWAKHLFWGENMALTTDGLGNVFAAGNFNNTVDFSFGKGTAVLSGGTREGYLLKFKPDGETGWAKHFKIVEGQSGSFLAGVYPENLFIDKNCNIITSGVFAGKTDFDPSENSHVLNYSSSIQLRERESYILKLEQTDIVSGINDLLSEKTAVKTYPNPTASIVYISSDNFHDRHDVVVYNLLGEKLLQQTYVHDQIDISGLSNGLYILEIHTGEITETFRIIKGDN